MRLELVDPYAAPTEALWRRLEAEVRPSYFGTWGWIENWLATLPHDRAPRLAVLYEGSETVGAFFLGRQHVVRHHLVPSRAAYVNTTGSARYDALCGEHDRLLLDPRVTVSLRELVELLPHDWDELFLPRVEVETFADSAVPPGYRVLVDREVPAPFVDLARVRASGDYLALLSANTRAQIRRSFRHAGECELEVAETPERALEIYEELVGFHIVRWRDRGEPGAFADPWFETFHRRLVTTRFAAGDIQMARLHVNGKTIGCLYNLIAYGRVLVYRSGLARFASPSIKPGYMCHAAAIAHSAAEGHEIYDFLGGDTRCEAALASGSIQLAWLHVQRERLRFALEDRVRTWRHAVRW